MRVSETFCVYSFCFLRGRENPLILSSICGKCFEENVSINVHLSRVKTMLLVLLVLQLLHLCSRLETKLWWVNTIQHCWQQCNQYVYSNNNGIYYGSPKGKKPTILWWTNCELRQRVFYVSILPCCVSMRLLLYVVNVQIDVGLYWQSLH